MLLFGEISANGTGCLFLTQYHSHYLLYKVFTLYFLFQPLTIFPILIHINILRGLCLLSAEVIPRGTYFFLSSIERHIILG